MLPQPGPGRCNSGQKMLSWASARTLPYLARKSGTPMTTKPLDAAAAFAELVSKYSYKREGRGLLTNITFFVGAGFSKSWDSRSPTGNELFTFTKEFIAANADKIEVDELLTQPGYP